MNGLQMCKELVETETSSEISEGAGNFQTIPIFLPTRLPTAEPMESALTNAWRSRELPTQTQSKHLLSTSPTLTLCNHSVSVEERSGVDPTVRTTKRPS